MKLIRPILYVLSILVGVFLLFLLYATIANYRPDDFMVQSVEDKEDILSDSMQLNMLIWNIGYAGLDASMDFFYDGGERMRPSPEGVRRNMDGIRKTLDVYREYDFLLLQEVDKNSKRSYHINQYQELSDQFSDYSSYFGKNYDVDFVPIPLSEPMGRVNSGLMTLSKHDPVQVERHSFPGNYAWPMGVFMLDRCFLVNRYQLSNQEELLVINTHNSAYDDGSLRAQQMDFLRTFLLAEYEKGNYVIVGGDWNQTPYGQEARLPSHRFDTENLSYVEKDYPAPGWIWAYDPLVPTNRRLAFPYDRASSLTTVIDCYLLSPNIALEHIQTIDLDFQLSDHQPVQLQARLAIKP